MTLADVLSLAAEAWGSRPGSQSMASQARACVDVLGADTEALDLDGSHGLRLLTTLRGRGLSDRTVASYYAAFRRALSLAEVYTVDWPLPAPVGSSHATKPKPDHETALAVEAYMRAKGWSDSGDLVALQRATAFRAPGTAFHQGSRRIILAAGPGDFDTLTVGSRSFPLVDPEARAIVRDPQRLRAIRALKHRTVTWRWSKALRAVKAVDAEVKKTTDGVT